MIPLDEGTAKFEQSKEVIDLAEATGIEVEVLSKWLAVTTDTNKIDESLILVNMITESIKEG